MAMKTAALAVQMPERARLLANRASGDVTPRSVQ